MLEKYYVVSVHRNLRKKVWSVRFRGQIRHLPFFAMYGRCWAHINGVQQHIARSLKQRNVHAYIKGLMTPSGFETMLLRGEDEQKAPFAKVSEVIYNPFKNKNFLLKNGNEVIKVFYEGVYFSSDGRMFVNNSDTVW